MRGQVRLAHGQRRGHGTTTDRHGLGRRRWPLSLGKNVRQYAMANTAVKRPSRVGCGLCAHICPCGERRPTCSELYSTMSFLRLWTNATTSPCSAAGT